MVNNQQAMKNMIKAGLLFLFALAFFASCNRNVDKELFAPKTVSVSSTYSIPGSSGFKKSNANPKFYLDTLDKGDSVFFRAYFGQTVEWQVKLVGQSSSAVKVFNGVSVALDSTNTKWKGTTDNQTFFRTGETVIAELSIRGATKTYYDTLVIGREINYIGFQGGIMVSNFNLPFSGASSGAYPPEAGKTFADFTYITIDQTFDFKALEGSGTVKYDGEDLENKSFIGGIYIQNPNDANTSLPVVYSIDSLIDPSKVWINLFIYGVPNSSSQIDLAVKELDQQPGTPVTNGDIWRFRFVMNWTGWKLVSVRYSDFTLTADSRGGNNKREPGKFNQFQLNAGPNPNLPGGKVQFYADFMTVTFGKPFQF